MVSAMKKSLERGVDIVQSLLGMCHVMLEILNVGIHSVLVLVHLVVEVELDFYVGELIFQVIHDCLL